MNVAEDKKKHVRIYSIFIIILLVIILLLGQWSFHISDPAKGVLRNDYNRFIKTMEDDYIIERTTTFPNLIDIDDHNQTLLLIIDPDGQRGYTHAQVRMIERYLVAGGALIYADSDATQDNIVEFLDIFRIGVIKDDIISTDFEKNVSFIRERVQFNDNSYNITFNSPGRIMYKGELENEINFIHEGGTTFYMDFDRDGRIGFIDGPFEKPALIISCTNYQRNMAIGNGAIFTDDFWERGDNSDFILAIFKDLLPSGGRIIIDESVHSKRNSGYLLYDDARTDTQVNFINSDDDSLVDVDEIYRFQTSAWDEDTDDDGLPDDWEIYNGLDPNVPDQDLDPDADGYSNWAEYVANTNPNNPYSHP